MSLNSTVRQVAQRIVGGIFSGIGLRRFYTLLDEARRAELIAEFVPRMGYSQHFRYWESRGFHITPVHFYQPIPDTRQLEDRLWQCESELVGVVMNEDAQLMLLDTFASLYRHEYEAFPAVATSVPHQFFLSNGAYGSVDAEILYSMIRHFKPRRVYEIGSGSSTLLAAQAIGANRLEAPDYSCELIAFEPYPNEVLRAGFPGFTRLEALPVQAVPLNVFAELAENDILFIDSTHVLSIGSDVHYEFLEIIPRLNKGVIVHVHDIFLPGEYPRSWVMEHNRFWTEQYLLQAFLAFNSGFEVLWCGSYIHARHPEALEKAIPSYDRSKNPGSFWMRKVA